MNWGKKYLYCYTAFVTAWAIYSLADGRPGSAAWDIFCVAFCWRVAIWDYKAQYLRMHLWP